MDTGNILLKYLPWDKVVQNWFEPVQNWFSDFWPIQNQNQNQMAGGEPELEPNQNRGSVQLVLVLWTGSEPNFGIPTVVSQVCPDSSRALCLRVQFPPGWRLSIPAIVFTCPCHPTIYYFTPDLDPPQKLNPAQNTFDWFGYLWVRVMMGAGAPFPFMMTLGSSTTGTPYSSKLSTLFQTGEHVLVAVWVFAPMCFARLKGGVYPIISHVLSMMTDHPGSGAHFYDSLLVVVLSIYCFPCVGHDDRPSWEWRALLQLTSGGRSPYLLLSWSFSLSATFCVVDLLYHISPHLGGKYCVLLAREPLSVSRVLSVSQSDRLVKLLTYISRRATQDSGITTVEPVLLRDGILHDTCVITSVPEPNLKDLEELIDYLLHQQTWGFPIYPIVTSP
ncbi:hypothetical protein BYT27DRAFT_7291527 [Phlegmacium glaucopus]|nr:hypothetical protein BYT27DRAFT_7291527 [Phlegmacium glaucopus]